jgi:sugar phosphate isomerase/epimerase
VFCALIFTHTGFADDANPFFAMDTALRDGKERTAAEQAVLVKRLGYDGFGASGYLAEDFLRAFEQQGVKVYNTYLTLSFDGAKPGLEPQLKEFVARLKGHNTDLWIAVQSVTKDGVKLKPSSPEGDEVVLPPLRELADLAHASGVSIALYPHTGFWLERVDDAIRVTRKANRANIGVAFNLCHWLKVEGDRDPEPTLKDVLAYLHYATINGADGGDTKQADWSKLIQPLDAGSYDVGSLLKSLREIGYRGPIGFQGYGIKGDSEEILRRTMTAWRRMNKQ